MDESVESIQKFGGDWTRTKLNIFTEYLNSYLTALKHQSFRKIYIDAFAGTGEIEVCDGTQRLVGSAKIALDAEQKFDEYYFIEKDPTKEKELEKLVCTYPWWLQERVHIVCGDAAIKLKEIIQHIDWTSSRGLLFLDPYATQVHWGMLQCIAATNSIDVWYLFPYHAMNRMLTRNKDALVCEKRLDLLFGDTSWRTEFYKESPEMSLFAAADDSEEVKQVKLPDIESYLLNRLKNTFAKVSPCPRVFRNSKNSPMFIFFFSISNRNPKAWGLALRMANYILKKAE